MSEAHRERHYRLVDAQGRPYTHGELTAPGTRNGRSGLPWRGFDVSALGRHWITTVEKLEELNTAGRIYWPAGGGWPRLIRYQAESRGSAIGDVWEDIPPLNMKARERLGYPTQKPEALLERIISASSNAGDIVLDPCGCGTTVAVAERLNRDWIGIDISPTAMEVMRRRLWRQNPSLEYRVEGLPDTVGKLKTLKPFEFQNWVIQRMAGYHSPRKVGDMGIDGYTYMTRDPIQVKQSEKVGRNVVDNFETALRRAGADTGYIVAFSFTSNAHEEVARAKWSDRLYIRLLKVGDLLNPPEGTPVADLIRRGRESGTLVPFKDPKDKPTPEELIASDQRQSYAAR